MGGIGSALKKIGNFDFGKAEENRELGMRRLLCFLFLLLLACGSCVSLPPAAERVLCVYAGLGCLLLLVREVTRSRRLGSQALLEITAACIFLLYRSLKLQGSGFYRGICGVSTGFSRGAGRLFQRPLSMGPSYSGAEIVLLFAIVLVCMRFLYEGAFSKGFRRAALLIVPIWALYLLLWSLLAESSLLLGLNGIEPLTGALDYRILLFGQFFALLTWAAGKVELPKKEEALVSAKMKAGGSAGEREREGGRRGKKLLLLSAAFFCLLLTALFGAAAALRNLAAGASARRVQESGRIVFLDTGIDFRVPERGVYGLEQTGMFGMLPRYLRDRGYECAFSDEIGQETLENCAVLVIFNPMRPLSETELDLVFGFVKEGGAVLAAGDHTGGEQIRLPLNEILRPAGISLNFDSAVPFHELWSDGLVLHEGGILDGLRKDQIQVVVGASLSVQTPARVLVTGRNAYSDAGNEKNTEDGLLGNMRFERGEPVGDLVLAAEAEYEKGRFIVFGDTTPFQNTVLAYSYPLIDRIFSELAGEGEASKEESADHEFSFSCVINAGHLEGFARDKKGNSLDGLIASVMRMGGMAYVNRAPSLEEFARRDSGRRVSLIVLTEPALAFSERELSLLTEYAEGGGSLLLCADYESPSASQKLAEHFGFFFEAMPLGRVAPESDPKMAFWNACPLLFEGEGVKILTQLWGYPTSAYRKIGKGRVYAFADADFFKNKNLEDMSSYREGNVLFTERLLAEMLEDRN